MENWTFLNFHLKDENEQNKPSPVVQEEKAKERVYNGVYARLDSQEGEEDLYRLTRQRDKDEKYVQQVRVIKDKDEKALADM